jgi:hypothetical protein
LAESVCFVAAAWFVAEQPARDLNPFLVLANGPNAGTSHPAATAAVEISKAGGTPDISVPGHETSFSLLRLTQRLQPMRNLSSTISVFIGIECHRLKWFDPLELKKELIAQWERQ